jgi:MFS family permease
MLEAPAPAVTGPDADRLPLRPLRHHLALTIYWLSNTLLWGALLHVGFQSRTTDWFGEGELGWPFMVIGFVGGIVGTVSQIAVGALSDRCLHPWGRRRIYVLAGTMLGAGALMLLGMAKSFWPFAGALVLVQLFTNAALGPFTALLPDTVNPREHGKASGFMGVARLLGDTGGLILAGYLLSTSSLGADASQAQETAFHDERWILSAAIMGAFLIVTMAVTCLTIKERRLRRRPEATAFQTVLKSFDVDVRGNPDFFWLSVSRAVTNVGFYMFLTVMIFFVEFTMGYKDAEGTSMRLMLPAIAAAAISSIASGVLSDRIGRRCLIFAAQFIMAASALGFALTPSLTWAYVAIIPGGVAYGVFTAVEWALACNLLPTGESARYLGVWNASAVVPQIIAMAGGITLGSAISRHHPGLGWRVDYGIVVVCCLVGACFLKHVQERRQPAPATEESQVDASEDASSGGSCE